MSSQDIYPAESRLRRLVRQYVDNRQWDAAQATLESLARHLPGDAAVLIELADVLFRRGRLREATARMLQVAGRLPRDGPLIVGVAKRLVAFGEILAARGCLDLLAQAPSPPPELLVAQANLRFSIGEIAAAKMLMEKAIAAGIDSPGALHLYAMLLQFGGDIDRACTVLEGCLERWPHFGDAAMALVNLHKQRPEDHPLDLMQAQLRRLPPGDPDPAARFVRAEFEYAQFKILDDLGRHVEAWPALARYNAIMHELNPYDATAEAAVTDALMDMPLPDDAARTMSASAFEGPTPIFIVGMPRSGTTLLDRMLSRHSQIVSAGEIIDFWRQLHWVADVSPGQSRELLETIQRSADIDYAELGARYLRQTQWRAQGRAYYIDKLPANIRMVAFIRKALPHARILHMVRDPVDTCFSNFKAMFGNVSPYSYDLGALAHYYGQYARLARHWHARFPGTMLDVPYASLVRDPENTLRQVLEHCGLALEEGCLSPELNASPVATPSSAQVREAIHTRSLDLWRNYAEHLQPLHLALGESPAQVQRS
ncbi:sulfotransferase family protein [Rhodanobacter denitrificans]|uniref:Sulfotransferase family protein n=1 Tax=Rhodanobacter denitrificans TaxID=666685 RepID=A0A368K9R0_9GAMM|nr:tetratricopeptide repeat-containing sulfotransferase family protein [Rhodanobacter denitrificans]RCS28680.1 sulfotransferase family protein [Rhodanobacter denitrificans]